MFNNVISDYPAWSEQGDFFVICAECDNLLYVIGRDGHLHVKNRFLHLCKLHE